MPTNESVAKELDVKPIASKTLKRVARPDSEAQKKEVDEINRKIKTLKDKQEDIQKKIDGTSDVNGSFETRRKEVFAKIDELTAEKNRLSKEYTEILEQIKAKQPSMRKKNDEASSTQKIHGYKTAADFNKAVRDLEKQLESGKLTLIEEKRVVSDISSLKKMRSQVEAEMQTIDSCRQKLDLISKKRDEVRKQLDEYHAQRKEIIASQSGYSELKKSRNSIKGEVDALYTQLKELRATQKAQWDEYKAYQEQEFQARHLQEKLRRKEEMLQKLEQRAAEELEYVDVPAYTDEINTCNAIIDYLKSLTKTAATSEKAESTEVKTSSADIPSGTVVLQKKDDRNDDFLVMGSPKKKGSKKADSGKKAIKLDLQMIQQFSDLKVEIPAAITDVERAIKDLETKRDEFKKNQPAKTAENKIKAEKERAELKAQIAKAMGESITELSPEKVKA